MAHEVVKVDSSLARGAGEAIAAGFHDNEIWSWMLPSDRRRQGVLRRYYPAILRHVYVARGTAWTTPDCAGGALWMAPGVGKAGLRERLIELFALLPGGIAGLERGGRFEELVTEHHPTEPHWYLSTLSVRPGAQGSGYGSALMAPGLARADAEGLPAYVETQRQSNIPFYRRFGFEFTEEIKLPDSPPLWLMWRPAAGR